MEFKGVPFSEDELREKHPGLMAAIEALRQGGEAIYCNPCDGLRLKVHTCYCWHCRAPLKESPNPECHICQLILEHFSKEIQ